MNQIRYSKFTNLYIHFITFLGIVVGLVALNFISYFIYFWLLENVESITNINSVLGIQVDTVNNKLELQNLLDSQLNGAFFLLLLLTVLAIIPKKPKLATDILFISSILQLAYFVSIILYSVIFI